MMKDLLLVIDMQNVYTDGGHWQCVGTEAAAQRIHELIDAHGGSKFDVAFTRFDPPVNPEGQWEVYNRINAEVNADEEAGAMMEIFAEQLKKYPLYSKSIYSAMDISEIRELVSKADRVLVCGVVAECCVLATVMALIDMGQRVVYLTDGVAGESEETARAVETVLAGLDPLHVQRMTIGEYLEN